jgi:MYXO-CTERM domain-containing protein
MDLDFTVTSGTLTVDTDPDGIASPDPAVVNLGGTFAAQIESTDFHIDESDTILLGASNLTNSEPVVLSLLGLATATIDTGETKFTQFMQPTAAHIGAGGVGSLQTDAAFEALIVVTGLMEITFSTATSAGELLDFDFTITTSDPVSGTVTLNLGGVFSYEIGVSDITQTLTLDLVIDVVGTAHVVPDPAFGGLTALGLAGAGAWLRRRS